VPVLRPVKEYPSIPRAFREFDAYVFDKLDGSSMRFEWWRKRDRFYKFGARHRLIDATDEQLGAAVSLFEKTLAEPLARVFRDLGYESAIAYCEFWGRQSLGGYHVPGDPMRLTLFDVEVARRGILPPDEFRRFEDHVPTARYLGKHRWTRGFVERVRRGELGADVVEGVVGKGRIGKKAGKLVMAKAKTQKWIDAIRARYAEKAQEMIDS
jgi:hypothetical protein